MNKKMLIGLVMAAFATGNAFAQDEINTVVDAASAAFEEAGGNVPSEVSDNAPENDLVGPQDPGDAPAGSWVIDMTGSIIGMDAACSVNSGGNQTLTFQSDAAYADFTGTSAPITLTFSCGADREDGAPVYLSTNDSDPETGSGSSELVAEFTDGSNGNTSSIPVTILSDADDSQIGSSAPVASWSSGGGTNDLVVYGTIAQEDIDSNMQNGGTIAASANSRIYLWVK